MATVVRGDKAKSDVERLHELGYAQELLRKMGGFSNFAVSFTIISILSGCLTLYGTAMNTGGPVEMSIGWPIVGSWSPSSGWRWPSWPRAFRQRGDFITGRRSYPARTPLPGVGLPAGSTCSARWPLPPVSTMVSPCFATAFLNLTVGYPATPGYVYLVFAVALLIHGLLNTFGVRLVARLNDISVVWHIVGVLIIVVALAILPHSHQSVLICLHEDCQ